MRPLLLLTGLLGLVPAQLARAPFVASPPDVVDRMLRLAGVGPGDLLYDLGSGDGRIVIAAAQTYGARAVGVDIDPARVAEGRANAARAGVQHLATFKLQDVMDTDVSEATVVTVYLLAAQNVRLRPLLTRQLRPGARVVSHNFAMGDWRADAVDTFTSADGQSRTLYLWNADGRVRP
jgi:SAM-dependent methyltransferase